jgi:hypothetical protein
MYRQEPEIAQTISLDYGTLFEIFWSFKQNFQAKVQLLANKDLGTFLQLQRWLVVSTTSEFIKIVCA